jgi:hypothetical protein
MRTCSSAALVLLALCAAAVPAVAQVPADSIPAWTARLQTGTLDGRAGAAGKLAAQDPASLPAATRTALIAELSRVNRSLRETGTVEGAYDLGGETFAEYYLDLVITVSHFRTPDAVNALVHSVGVGRGVQRRVARHGDAVVPELTGLVRSGHQRGDALQTLGLAWFWADSTQATLAPESEVLILDAFVLASTSDDYALLRATGDALVLSGEPAFLPLVELVEARAVQEGHNFVLLAVRQRAAPALTRIADRVTPAELAQRVARVVGATCRRAAPGAGRTACESAHAQLTSARADLSARRTAAARARLQAVVEQTGRARGAGALTEAEHALIAGGAGLVLDRL